MKPIEERNEEKRLVGVNPYTTGFGPTTQEESYTQAFHLCTITIWSPIQKHPVRGKRERIKEISKKVVINEYMHHCIRKGRYEREGRCARKVKKRVRMNHPWIAKQDKLAGLGLASHESSPLTSLISPSRG